MASQQKPPAPDGPDGAGGGSSVRRAVSLGSAAADPGPMLAPAARRTAEPEAARAPENETAPTGEAETAAAAAAPDTEERPEAESRGVPDAEAAHGTGVAAATAATATAGATAAATATAAAGAGAGEPPSGNPKKPLLAAAGIAGVVLLAVPLLIWATDDARQKKDDVTVAAGSDTLLEEEPLEVPKGDYAPAEPTPEPSTEKPSPKASAVTEKPAPVVSSAPASKEPEETEKARTQVKERKAPKLPPNTAAYAVQRMAASHPGRHICYRVHVKGAGWTAPVCDGATAGHEGSGRAITAINIAVADAKRVNGNEFIQKDGWTTAWSGAADGTDLTLGSAASNAPSLSGFTIGVESGNVCQNNKLGGHGWGGLACEQPQGWIFGGSTDPKVWLEAVRFTV